MCTRSAFVVCERFVCTRYAEWMWMDGCVELWMCKCVEGDDAWLCDIHWISDTSYLSRSAIPTGGAVRNDIIRYHFINMCMCTNMKNRRCVRWQMRHVLRCKLCQFAHRSMAHHFIFSRLCVVDRNWTTTTTPRDDERAMCGAKRGARSA